MKRKILFLFLMFFFTSFTQAQLVESSWSFGFGGSYSRLMNHNVNLSSGANYGAFFNFQRNFTENVGLRIQPSYSHIGYENNIPGDSYSDVIGLDFDFIYYVTPCKSITPYFILGGGPMMYMLTKPENSLSSDYYFSGKINFGLGFEWIIGRDWSMGLELDYSTTMTDQLDGKYGSGTGGILTDELDSYMTAGLGFKYFFSKGKLSKDCMLPGGVADIVMPEEEKVDYDKIQKMIKQNLPKVVTREVVVEKPKEEEPAMNETEQHWVLEGVNFRSGSSTLTNASYTKLYEALDVLKQNPDMRIEIQGHTDSTGPMDFNLRLSERRAQSVKDFLVANGISSSRLVVRGYGESQPIADNYTEHGRMLNRRIEFKILSQ
jgi:outer membrane protein OmpA-like peptidoglycan-associated protein